MDISSDKGKGLPRFFVIEEETAEDSRAWADTFGDERLAMFGHLGYGWVLWFEGGRLREVEQCAGRSERSRQDIAERTRAMWP